MPLPGASGGSDQRTVPSSALPVAAGIARAIDPVEGDPRV